MHVLDYGCGHGKDVETLRSLNFSAVGFDPYWRDVSPGRQNFDIVLCTYVLNVLRRPEDRARALRYAWEYVAPGGRMFVTVRRDIPVHGSQTQAWVTFREIVDVVKDGAVSFRSLYSNACYETVELRKP